ncbi:hypothetical protein PAERUG_P62_London_9_VIM_2_01_14_03406 [Pseudomonas aeruginosa]|nr:hypothetical protein PAERUG_P62_London_9_VIM_2_01_14_03406 [Pseudomonas aeruginosa]
MATEPGAGRRPVLGGAGRHEPGDAAGLPLAETRRLAPRGAARRPAVHRRQPGLGVGRQLPAAARPAFLQRPRRRLADDPLPVQRRQHRHPEPGLRALGDGPTGGRRRRPGAAAGAVRTLRPGRLLPVAGRPDGPRPAVVAGLPQRQPAGGSPRQYRRGSLATAGRAGHPRRAHLLYQPQRRLDLHQRHRRRRGDRYRRQRRGTRRRHPDGHRRGGLRLLHRQPPAARPDAARRLPGDGRGDPPADRPAAAGALRPGRAAVQVHLDLRPAVHPRLPRRPGPLRPPDERLQPGHRRRAGHRPGGFLPLLPIAAGLAALSLLLALACRPR